MVAAAVIGSAVVGAAASSAAANKASKAQNRANDSGLAAEREMFDISMANSNSQNAMAMANSNRQHSASLALQRHIADMSIGEQRAQFDAVQKVLSPYVSAGNQALQDLKPYQKAGTEALQGQRALIGMNGQGAQSSAIQGLANSPEMAAYIQQGENSMLQNAAATGGLRGGNTQAAMGQFRPQLLAGMINQQYSRLGEMTALGANTTGMVFQTGASAAAGQANAGMQVAGNIGNTLSNYASGAANSYSALGNQQATMMGNMGNQQAAMMGNMGNAYSQYYNNQGAIAAGNAMAQGQAINNVSGAVGQYAMLKGMKVF
jgi:hypothetical protein